MGLGDRLRITLYKLKRRVGIVCDDTEYLLTPRQALALAVGLHDATSGFDDLDALAPVQLDDMDAREEETI